MKKIVSLVLSVMVILCALPFSVVAIDIDSFNSKLSSFKSKKYANNSTYVDNPSKTGGYECFGFANELALWIYGSYPTSSMGALSINNGWSRTYGGSGVDNLAVGDIVRYYYHSIFITKISGDTIYYAQANVPDGTNKVTYDNSIKKSTLRSRVNSTLTHDGATTKGWVAHFKDWTTTKTLTINYSPNGGTVTATNKYKVSTDGVTLNLRSSASTSASVVASIPDGTVFTVSEKKEAGGYTWGKTSYNGKTGWCALDYGALDYAVRQDYYASSGKIYKYSNSKLATTSCDYGKTLGGNGLYNASTFNIKKSGYKFIGWCTDANPTASSVIYAEDDANIKAETICPSLSSGSKTITLYAVWEPTTLTMYHSANGGTISETSNYKASGALKLYNSASTSGTVITTIPDATIVSVAEKKTAGGYTWGKTSYNDKTGWCILDDTVRQGYYINSDKVYQYSNSKIVSLTWDYGSGGKNGLWNASSFGLTKKCHKFVGWSKDKVINSSSVIFDQDDTALKAEDIESTLKSGDRTVTLYAVWELIEHTYAVTENISATYREAGEKKYVCEECGESKTEILYAFCDLDKNGTVDDTDKTYIEENGLPEDADVSQFDFDTDGNYTAFDKVIVKLLISGLSFKEMVDTNGDGESNLLDIVSMKRLTAQNGDDTDCDRNRDGKTDANDFIFSSRFLISLDKKYL